MDYPWYQVVHGTGLEQGDILESCPVFLPCADAVASEPDTLLLDEEIRDVIVVSQSCDLVAGREKISDILLCRSMASRADGSPTLPCHRKRHGRSAPWHTARLS